MSLYLFYYWSQGNLQFVSDGESVDVVGGDTVKHIAELTTSEDESVYKTLLYRTVATGGGEVISKGHSEQEASYGRDAFAKVNHSFPVQTGSVIKQYNHINNQMAEY